MSVAFRSSQATSLSLRERAGVRACCNEGIHIESLRPPRARPSPLTPLPEGEGNLLHMHSVLVYAIISLFLAGCHSPSAAESHARGVAFLVSAQNDDGSWGTFHSERIGEIYLDNLSSHHAFRDATSALCVLALQKPSRINPAAETALEKGLEFLLTVPPAGRASGGTFYDTWTHTYLVQALSTIYQDDRPELARFKPRIAEVAQREIMILRERQGLEGGWGYYDFGQALTSPTGNMSTSFNTAAALLALDEAKRAGFAVPQSMIDDGISCVERLRLPSGAYVYGTYAQMVPQAGYNKVKGSLGRSQSCNLALWTYQREITREQLCEGVENLRKYHYFIEIGKGRPIPHEGWYYTAGYYYLFGHYYASRVINQLDEKDRARYRRWLIDMMVKYQDPGGSWFDFPLYGYHKCYGAAFGCLTLQECGVE